jgi:hypothetical protein
MKLFKAQSKINFVDENNVLVGYDLSQQCCEHAFYVILDHIPKDLKESLDSETLSSNVDENNLDDYRFNTDVPSSNDHNETYYIVFSAYNIKNNKNIYIILCNAHNGYYSHGFIMYDDNKIIVEGDL